MSLKYKEHINNSLYFLTINSNADKFDKQYVENSYFEMKVLFNLFVSFI